MNTLIARIGIIEQYDAANKIITYRDDVTTRWQKVYGKLQPDDNGIFIGKTNILIGKLSSKVENTYVRFENVIEVPISNDQLLQLDEAYPEFMSQVKANFTPFIHRKEIDIKSVIDSALNHRFVSYYMVHGKGALSNAKNFLQPNDRLVVIENNVIKEILKYTTSGSVSLELPRTFILKGYSLKDILQLQRAQKEGNSNNVKRVENIINTLSNQSIFKFDSFFAYHDTIHNNRVYGKADENDFIDEEELEINNMQDPYINQILFGPPGTGKTYHTVNEAVKITDPEFYSLHQNNREKLKERFRELLISDWQNTRGQIAFCTFHQSFSYEDFVEGIKPVAPKEAETSLTYRVEDGIFKLICKLAELEHKSKQLKIQPIISWNDETFKKAIFYKISLGNSNKEDDQAIYEYCIKNNCIALGYGDETDFTGLDEEQVTKKCNELGKESFTEQAVNRFIHYLKDGNYVLVSNGNRYVRAIGNIAGPYKYDPNTSIRYRHFRPVEWLLVDQAIPITELYDRSLSQQTLYKLDEDGIKKEFFVNNGRQVQGTAKTEKNYVLIIDEINRGNVSAIFGELITLIEKDKRARGSEKLEVTLPYSKETFKVPSNVYIVATMNTADRSIEALDTALRRRFSFREMPSIPEIVRREGASKGKIGSIDLTRMLIVMNERIEKLIGKDHGIGHAYFMEDKTEEDLANTFHNKVIPLLQEYFFGDFGKIGLILGNSFIEKSNDNQFAFAKFNGYEDTAIVDDLKSRPVFKITDRKQWNFTAIYA